jgi:quercetin dioxygenase-like cupin family protein
MLKSVLILAAFGMVLQGSDKEEMKPQVVPITEEHHHHLVLDNEYVRVFHVEVAPHAETRYHQHDMDYVFVTLGDSQVESVRVGEKPVKLDLKDGDTRLTKGGFAHKAVNLSDKPFVNVTVELKKSAVIDNGILYGTCEGVCEIALLKANNFKCFELRTSGSGIGMGLPEPANRLVVMLTDGVDADTKASLKSGDSFWKAKGFKLRIRGDHPGSLDAAKLYPLRAVVCEFAKAGEDFLKK